MFRGGSRLVASASALVLLVASAAAVAASLPGARPPSTPRWRLVFFDDFHHGLSPVRWGLYSGQPGGDPGGRWARSHTVVRGGLLRLESYRDPRFGGRWVSGGLSSARALKQTYGKYEVRLRVQRGKGIAFVALLWPVADHWPPEIDFAETGGETRDRGHMSATLHYGPDNTQVQRSVAEDFSRWHTLGVEWTPGQLVYTLDGHRWGRVRSAAVPAEPMELDLQTQAGTCGDAYAPCPDATTPRRVEADIAWVAAWRWRRR